MSKIISVISGKGGVGKSTFVSNIILELSQNINKKVLVVDMDIGNIFLMLSIPETKIKYDIIDVIYDNKNLSESIYKYKKNLYVLGLKKHYFLDSFDNDKFKDYFNKLKSKFDVIILDVGAGINSNFRKSIYSSDYSIIVLDSTALSYKISEKTIKYVNTINPYIKNYSLINKYDVDLAKKGILIDKEYIVNNFKIPLIGAVPFNKKNISFVNLGIPAILSEKNTKTTKAYQNIAKRIMEKMK